jgi:hypothetical protein
MADYSYNVCLVTIRDNYMKSGKEPVTPFSTLPFRILVLGQGLLVFLMRDH